MEPNMMTDNFEMLETVMEPTTAMETMVEPVMPVVETVTEPLPEPDITEEVVQTAVQPTGFQLDPASALIGIGVGVVGTYVGEHVLYPLVEKGVRKIGDKIHNWREERRLRKELKRTSKKSGRDVVAKSDTEVK